jgi:hypothetical protein
MSYFIGMSPAEAQFIRVYVSALRRHYADLRSVVDIMDPDGLGVKDFYDATNTALYLNRLQDDFDTAVESIQKKHQLKTVRSKPFPTEDDIADLFSLSFFKLITTQKSAPDALTKTVTQNGWFSGKPEEWQNTLKAYNNISKDKMADLPDLLSQFFNAFAKFFYLSNKFSTNLPPHYGKKIWPLAADNMYEDYDDDEDDADEPDNPFGWLPDDEE